MTSAYSPGQLQQYLEHVGLPPKYHPNAQPSPARDFEHLKALFVHQLAYFPYENLSLHYNPEHDNSIDPAVLFDKMITQKRGRGGYCMENAIFFLNILLGSGFKAYLAGVRIRARPGGAPVGGYIGWRHLVIIVTLDDASTYACDVSFGGDGPTQPLRLEDGYTIQNIGTQEVSLVHDYIGEQTSRLPHQKLWIYRYRNASDKPWNPFYAFGETEFFPIDFEGLNYYVSQHKDSFQRFRVLVIKFLKRDSEESIYGKLMLVDGVLKVNRGGRTEVLKILNTEEERIDTLKEHFGLTLTKEQMEGIRGFPTELPMKEDFSNKKW